MPNARLPDSLGSQLNLISLCSCRFQPFFLHISPLFYLLQTSQVAVALLLALALRAQQARSATKATLWIGGNETFLLN